MLLFRARHFASKALIISLAFMVPMLLMVLWQLDKQAEQAEQALLARQDATRQHVGVWRVAHGVLAWAKAQEAAGLLTRELAQKTAMQAVAHLR